MIRQINDVRADVTFVQDRVVERAASTLVNNTVLFTISGGSIIIDDLNFLCVTANDATGSVIQLTGNAVNISGVSGSLANLAPGAVVALVPGTLATAPAVYSAGVGLAGSVGIIVTGQIGLVVGVGSTTGTWKTILRYRPLSKDVLVV